MPHEALITALDQLRENYSQQQKTANGLQTTLKGVSNALTKANKSLNDYSQQNSGVNPALVSNTQSSFAASRLKDESIEPLLPDLRREIKNLGLLVAALKDAAAALRVEPVDIVKLDHAYARLQNAQQPDIRDLLPQLGEEVQLAQRALGDIFGQALRDALAQQGISIAGRPPTFEIGRFEVDANFAKRSAVIRYGQDTVIPHVSISLDAVVKAYQKAAKEITGRNEDGPKWIKSFYEAYQFARRKTEATGTRVNIVDCYIELTLLRQGRAFQSEPSKRSFSDYSRAQFIYDFYEFTNRQRLSYQGLSVSAFPSTKSQTDKPTQRMWIVEGDSPYDGRYISDIEFVKA